MNSLADGKGIQNDLAKRIDVSRKRVKNGNHDGHRQREKNKEAKQSGNLGKDGSKRPEICGAYAN